MRCSSTHSHGTSNSPQIRVSRELNPSTAFSSAFCPTRHSAPQAVGLLTFHGWIIRPKTGPPGLQNLPLNSRNNLKSAPPAADSVRRSQRCCRQKGKELSAWHKGLQAEGSLNDSQAGEPGASPTCRRLNLAPQERRYCNPR